MSKDTIAKGTFKQSNKQVLRYAHPFFTDTPPEKRKNIPSIGKRMTGYISH